MPSTSSPLDLAATLLNPTSFVDSRPGIALSRENNDWYIYQSARHAAALDDAGRVSGTAAERDIDFIVPQLALAPTDRLLEIGCGWGRHTLARHARGFRRLASVAIAPRCWRSLTSARRRSESRWGHPLASYVHLRFWSESAPARPFVVAAMAYRANRGGTVG